MPPPAPPEPARPLTLRIATSRHRHAGTNRSRTAAGVVTYARRVSWVYGTREKVLWLGLSFWVSHWIVSATWQC